MKLYLPLLTVAGIAGAALGTAAADDDRFPTSTELSAIEATLNDAGYTSWEEVEFDDGLWEVDDARKPGERDHDLKLDPVSYEIVSVVQED